jgi:hypothetical protein
VVKVEGLRELAPALAINRPQMLCRCRHRPTHQHRPIWVAMQCSGVRCSAVQCSPGTHNTHTHTHTYTHHTTYTTYTPYTTYNTQHTTHNNAQSTVHGPRSSHNVLPGRNPARGRGKPVNRREEGKSDGYRTLVDSLLVRAISTLVLSWGGLCRCRRRRRLSLPPPPSPLSL